MIPAMTSNKEFHPVVIELFIRGRKLNTSDVHHRIILSDTK